MKEALRRAAVPLAAAGLLAAAAVGGMLHTPPGQAPASMAATTTTSTPPTTATTTPAASTPTHRAQVDFGSPVGDAYLRALLERYEARPVAAYMTTAGFFGAHRAAASTDPAVFIASARAETAAGFSNGAGGGMTTRARDFVGTHTERDVAGDPEARRRAVSLLDLHARAVGGCPRQRGGRRPPDTLVEVHGAEAQLRLLGAERSVAGFEIAALGSDVRWPRPPLAEGPTGQGAPPSGAAAEDAQGLYERLSALARREIESGE